MSTQDGNAAPAGRPSSRKRLAFIAATLFLVWLLAEAASFLVLWKIDGHAFSVADMRARRADIARPPANAPMDRRWSVVPHPYLGFAFDPDYDGTVPVNEMGFPGAQSPVMKRSPDKVIVGVFGGSVAQEFAPAGAAALTRLLADVPRFRGRRFVVLPVAVGGFKQPQPLLAFEYLSSIGAEFDVVLEIDGFNEVALHRSENGKKGVFPAFPRNWFVQSTREHDPVIGKLVAEIRAADDARRALAASFEGSVLERLPSANLYWRGRDAQLAGRWKRASQELADYGPQKVGRRTTGPRREYPKEEDVYEELVAVWRRSSLLFDGACRGAGAEYFHFLQPDQYVAGSKRMGEEEMRVAYRADHPYRRGVEVGYPILRREGAALAGQGVRFRDLTQVFADVAEPVYRDDMCHLNQRGNDLLAEAVGRAVVEALSPR